MKHPWWLLFLDLLLLLALPIALAGYLLKLVGLLPPALKTSPFPLLAPLLAGVLYLLAWGFLSPRVRRRINQSRTTREYEDSAWGELHERLRGAGRQEQGELLSRYSGELFVRRAYATLRDQTPHPVQDELFRERMLQQVLPLWAKLESREGEAAEVEALWKPLEAGTSREASGEELRAIAGIMRFLPELWVGQDPLGDAFDEVSLTSSAGSGGRPWWTWFVPGSGLLADCLSLRSERGLSRRVREYYLEPGRLHPFGAFFGKAGGREQPRKG